MSWGWVQVGSHKIRSWHRVSLLWDIMFIVPILIVKQKQLIEGHWHCRNTWLKTTEVRLIKIISLHFNTRIKYILKFNIWSDCIAGVGRQHFEEKWKQRFCWWFHKVPSFRYNFAYILFTRRHKLKHVSQMISRKQPLNIIKISLSEISIIKNLHQTYISLQWHRGSVGAEKNGRSVQVWTS